MMRSLFSGVSGLRTHQTRMDVIGNNIANVNTVAFKSSSMTFASLMSQTSQKASGANANTGTGGVNPRQIGLGVKTSAVNVNISGQGASQSTGNPFDLMITGSNLFVVSNGQQNYFTRDGSFYVDGAGNLAMTSIGYNVMGWLPDEETGAIKQDTVTQLRIMNSANLYYPPEATTKGYMSGILDKMDKNVTSSAGKVVNFKFFDALGYSYIAKFVFRQSDTAEKNEYSLELDKITDSDGKEVELGLDKSKLFGSAAKEQDLKTTLKLGADYVWNGTTLEKKGSPNNTAYVNLTDLIANGAWKPLDTVLTPATATTAAVTVKSRLEEIAKAYGKEDLDEFLNLRYTYTPAATAQDPNPTSTKYSIRNLLLNQGTAATGVQNISSLFPSGENVDVDGRYFDGVTVIYKVEDGKFSDADPGKDKSIITLKLKTGGLGDKFEDIEIDLSQTTNVDNKGTSTIGGTNGADDEFSTGSGRRNGSMSGITVQQNGMIYATYDNGMTKLLGQIATARFANVSGLEKLADNLYSATLNSGIFDGIGEDVTASGEGYMSTGQLEMSNVDLSSEFTEMITTQRGFQANSRIITVSDTLLEELTNLKR